MNIFERAARAKLRFSSSVGLLTTEDLFSLNLTERGNKPSLDAVAREVHKELKGLEEVSFVDTKPNPRKEELQLQMDILLHVIESKKSDLAAAETRAKRAELRRQLTEVLAAKQGEALKSMSMEDLQAKLAELSD